MKAFLFKIALVLIIVPVPRLYAQQELMDSAAFASIRSAETTDSHIPALAHYLTDVSGPRLTNSPGFFRAANWAVATMKQWGLANVALEPWGEYGRGYEVEDFHVLMKKPNVQSITGYALPWSPGTEGEISAFVSVMTSSQLKNKAFVASHISEIKGKIILMIGRGGGVDETKPLSTRYTDSDLMNLSDSYMVNRKDIVAISPVSKQFDEMMSGIKSAGALAVVYTSGKRVEAAVGVQASGGYKINSMEGLPQAILSADDGFKIKRLIQSGHQVQLTLLISGKFYSQDTKGYNVIAELPGSDPRLKAQVVMLGGQLDSWTAATGATDNAAGVVVAMEALRLLDSLHLRPKRTIRIALWSGEEQGLLGSYGYVKKHFGDAEIGRFTPEQANISVYFNLDNGSGKIRGIYTQKNAAVKSIFQQWLVPFYNLGAKTVSPHSTGSTDHLSFEWVGIPAFQFIQDPLDYETVTHHSNMDNYDHLQMDDLKQAAIILASFVYQAAVRPDLLPRTPPVKEKFVFDGY